MRRYRWALAALLSVGTIQAQPPAQPALPGQPAQPAQPGGVQLGGPGTVPIQPGAAPAQPGAVPAQPGAVVPPPPAPAADPKLDQLLNRWEKEMSSITSLQADLTRTTVDKVWGGNDVFVGKAKYVKPNFALLDVQKKGAPNDYEKFLCTGTFLYQFLPASKVINVFELPQPRPGQPAVNNDFLSFFFGMKATEAKLRYDLKLVKEDQHYFYLEVQPKMAADKADFTRARLVLSAPTMLPREVWFEQPNGNEVKWDLPKVERDVKIDRSEFAPPAQLPAGWNMVRVPRAENTPPPTNNLPPSRVRPQDK